MTTALKYHNATHWQPDTDVWRTACDLLIPKHVAEAHMPPSLYEYEKITCKKCGDLAFKALQALSPVDFDLVKCKTGTYNSAYLVVTNDTPVGILGYGGYNNGKHWNCLRLDIDQHARTDQLRGETGFLNWPDIPFTARFNFNALSDVYQDMKSRNIHSNHRRDFGSRDLAAYWMCKNQEPEFSFENVRLRMFEFVQHREQEARKKARAREAARTEENDAITGLIELWNRDDLTNFQRNGLKWALDYMMIDPDNWVEEED
jgi:hypothetical protein